MFPTDVKDLVATVFEETVPDGVKLSDAGRQAVGLAFSQAVPHLRRVTENPQDRFLKLACSEVASVAFVMLRHFEGGDPVETARWVYRAMDRVRSRTSIEVRRHSPIPKREYLEGRFAREAECLRTDGMIENTAPSEILSHFFQTYWGWNM